MAPIETRVDRQKDFTLKIVTGETSATEIIEEIESYYSGEPTTLILWDLSGGSFGKMISQDIERIVDKIQSYSYSRKSGKTAFVFSSLSGYGLGRMYEILNETRDSPIARRTFMTKAEAL
jgi:hypothetical protein